MLLSDRYIDYIEEVSFIHYWCLDFMSNENEIETKSRKKKKK